MHVCMSVRPSVSFSFFAIYSKNLQATHNSKFVTLCNIFLRMPLWEKNPNLVYEGVQHFLDTKFIYSLMNLFSQFLKNHLPPWKITKNAIYRFYISKVYLTLCSFLTLGASANPEFITGGYKSYRRVPENHIYHWHTLNSSIYPQKAEIFHVLTVNVKDML